MKIVIAKTRKAGLELVDQLYGFEKHKIYGKEQKRLRASAK